MKKRDIIKITLASWITPAVTCVYLPAHAMTSPVTRYAGHVSAQSEYSILREWQAEAFPTERGGMYVEAQNISNNINVAANLDDIGPFHPGWLTTNCPELADAASVSARELNDSEVTITLHFIMNVNPGEVFVTFVLPRSDVPITFPPISQECKLE